MYWAYTTMTTVGYGDISSNTVAEKLWAITVMIFSGFFFSYTISRMSALVSKLDADRQVGCVLTVEISSFPVTYRFLWGNVKVALLVRSPDLMLKVM